MARRLVVSCPNCGAPNAATVAVCIQCGANLKAEAITEMPPTSPPVSNMTQGNAPGYQPGGQTAVTSPPPQRSVQAPQNLAGNQQVGRQGSLAGLGAQAIFYVGCAILIALPILFIGLGPLRIMLARIFQH